MVFLPKREVQIAPWEEVPINLIGPWKVKAKVNKLNLMHQLALIQLKVSQTDPC
jgi:hypothetical protein